MQTSSLEKETLFDLGEFISYLITKWKWFIILGLCFAIAFAMISINMPNKYTSEILLADADSSKSNLDGLGSQLGGLASFAGIDMNSGKNDKLIALQILQSRKFLIDFVKNNQLEELLFAVDSWDRKNDSFVYNEDVFNRKEQIWLERSEGEGSFYPSDLEIHQLMKSMLEVDVDKTNKVTRMFLTYYNPTKAQEWLSMLVSALNDTIRINEINEREKQVSFLQKELKFENNSEIRNVFYSLIEEQIKSSTLAKAREEYVFRVIDPAVFPEQKSYPKRALNTVLGGLVGGVLCFIFFSLRFFVKA
ncbi:MAG: hypothetical protein ACJAXJ_003018 [Colwellia sp.]|jgi:uncharacterized protein involved in exopolysaccharide biosynthesis